MEKESIQSTGRTILLGGFSNVARESSRRVSLLLPRQVVQMLQAAKPGWLYCSFQVHLAWRCPLQHLRVNWLLHCSMKGHLAVSSIRHLALSGMPLLSSNHGIMGHVNFPSSIYMGFDRDLYRATVPTASGLFWWDAIFARQKVCNVSSTIAIETAVLSSTSMSCTEAWYGVAYASVGCGGL